MIRKNYCKCDEINCCPCMSRQQAVILAAIISAVLKVISIIVVCVFVVELDKYLKDEKDKHSGGSVSTEPSVEEMYAPVRNQYVVFLVIASLGIGFDISLLIGALLKNTFSWVSIVWVIGSVACWIMYDILCGIEFLWLWSSKKKQHMFTSYTMGITIWKWVEYAILFYFSFIVGPYRRQLLKERKQQTLEASSVAQIQAPAQDQPGDQSNNAENQIMNP